MQAFGRQPQRAPDGASVHYERHRPEQATLYRLVQEHAASFIAHTEASTGCELPQFIKAEPGHKQSGGLFVPGEGPGLWPGAACRAEFDAFLECGILAHVAQGCAAMSAATTSCWLSAASAARCSPSCGARRMSQTAAHLVDHVIPHVPVRQWVLSLPIPLRLLQAAQPELVTAVLQVVQRVLTRHLLEQAGLASDEGHGGAVTLIQRFGSPCRPRLASGQALRQAQTVHRTVCVRARFTALPSGPAPGGRY